jgi:hypothetical protein
MTRRHRQRHRILWCILAVVLPLLFAAGLLSRRDVPVMPPDVLPAATVSPAR